MTLRLLAKFATVGGATMASRVLGFAREVLIAAALGAGPVADAFYAAFRFPNLFRRLFAEGAFNTAFVPLFAKELESGGREAAQRFAEDVLAALVVILLLLTALAELCMPLLVATVIAPHFADTPEKFDLTVQLTRVMFPYLLAMSLVAMLSGVLNAYRRYFLAAVAPVVLNVILIAALLLARFTAAGDFLTGYALAWGVFIAGFAQLGMLAWGVRRARFSMRLRRPRMTAAVRRLLLLAAPVAATGGITQINLIVGQIIASAQDGAIAVLSYADRVYQLPLGVIGIAIGVVLLPELSRALQAQRESSVTAAALQNRSLEFAMVLTIPASVALALIPGPIVNVLFERGAFTAETTRLTAAALAAFAWGVPAFVLIKVFSPGFFAREDMRRPMWFAAASVVVNITASLALFPLLGHVGIAVATSLAGWLNAVLLAVTLWRRGHLALHRTTQRRLVMIGVASAVMGAVLYLAAGALQAWLHAPSLLSRGVGVALLVALGALVYGIAAILTGAVDLAELRGALSRRRGAAK